MTDEGMIKGADKTAPGGMSQAALRLELKEEHGISMTETRSVKWARLIEMVIEQRLAREAGQPDAPTALLVDCMNCEAWVCVEDTDHVALWQEAHDAERGVNEHIGSEYEVNEVEWDGDLWAPEYEEPPTLDEVREEVAAMDAADPDEEVVWNIDGETGVDRPEPLPVAEMFTVVAEFDVVMDGDEPVFSEPEFVSATFTPDEMFADESVSGNEDPTCVCGETFQRHTSEHNFVDAEHYGDADDTEALAEQFDSISDDMAFAPEDEHPLFIGMPNTRDYIFDGHAGAGPSGAERWMNCTASLAASRAVIESMSPNQMRAFASGNTAARQGTTAHAAAEVECRALLGEVTPEEVDERLRDLAIEPDAGEEYDEEMGEWIGVYVDLVKQYIDGGHPVQIERRVSAAIPLQTVDRDGNPHVHVITGSADVTAEPTKKRTDKTLTVGDLKYGNGIEVDVESNPQIRIYALGVLGDMADPETGALPDIEDIEYLIIQPRFGGVKVWRETVSDLLDWRDDVLSPALTEALGGLRAGAKYEPSDLTCQFCPARGNCAALAEQRMAAAADLFDVIVETEFVDGAGEFPETSGLDGDRLGELLAQAQGLAKITDDLKAEAQRRLHRGEPVKGYQLVNYQPPRKWTEGAAEALSENGDLWQTEPRLLSPTQAEKALGKDKAAKVLADLVIKPDPCPVIAREGDKRKTWTGKPPEQMFDVEEE